MFETAETYYQAAPGTTPAERAIVLHGRPPDAAAMVAAGRRQKAGITAAAFVNNSRWLVACPDLSCQGCQYASKTDPRFFCNYCHNAKVGGGWVDVTWPDDLDAIEKALAARLDPRTRNWTPGETVAALLAENEKEGA